MKSYIALLSAAIILCATNTASARGHGGGGGTHTTHGAYGGSRSSGSHTTTHTHAPKAPHVSHATVQHTTTLPNVARDSHGRIKRSPAAKLAFEKQHPCPATGKAGGACPGYVVDHIKPLATGGADDPSNMQWQTVADGKAKDKVERK